MPAKEMVVNYHAKYDEKYYDVFHRGYIDALYNRGLNTQDYKAYSNEQDAYITGLWEGRYERAWKILGFAMVTTQEITINADEDMVRLEDFVWAMTEYYNFDQVDRVDDGPITVITFSDQVEAGDVRPVRTINIMQDDDVYLIRQRVDV